MSLCAEICMQACPAQLNGTRWQRRPYLLSKLVKKLPASANFHNQIVLALMLVCIIEAYCVGMLADLL